MTKKKRMLAVAATACLALAGGGIAAQSAQAATSGTATVSHASKPAVLAGPPGYTYAGWFASFTGCDLHGATGQFFGEWSTYECLPLTENPDDGYELWIM